MRKALVTLLLLCFVAGRPVPVRAQDPGTEFGLAFGATVGNLVYFPLKVAFAFGGLVVGTMAGVLTGGDVRAAYAFWVPTASGTYFLTPSRLDGTEPLEFLGSDYADTASTATGEGSGIYEVQYSR